MGQDDKLPLTLWRHRTHDQFCITRSSSLKENCSSNLKWCAHVNTCNFNAPNNERNHLFHICISGCDLFCSNKQQTLLHCNNAHYRHALVCRLKPLGEVLPSSRNISMSQKLMLKLSTTFQLTKLLFNEKLVNLSVIKDSHVKSPSEGRSANTTQSQTSC